MAADDGADGRADPAADQRADQRAEHGGDDALRFDDDPGSGRETRIALGVVGVLVLWMASGFVFGSGDDASDGAAAEPRPTAVSVRASTAESVPLVFVAEGQTQPDRIARLRAELTATVAEILVERGDDVAAGALIARLVDDDRSAELRRAEEEVARAERELENAEALVARGAATRDRAVDARAALASAEAQRAAARLALADAEIRAPFAGRVDALDIEVGEIAQAGAEVGVIVDTRPLAVVFRVPQQAYADLQVGAVADVAVITGETRQGVVTFIGANADAATRTFLAEVSIGNADGAIPAGVSAEVSIVTGAIEAHQVSPAILSLDAAGALGVKAVDDADRVVFHPVRVVRAGEEGVWVAGLPSAARIVTTGQGFVRAGDQVDAQLEPADAAAAGDGA